MNVLSRNITAAIWALILSEVLAYITSQLEGMTPNYSLVGILAVVFCLISVNTINAISGSADPTKGQKNKK